MTLLSPPRVADDGSVKLKAACTRLREWTAADAVALFGFESRPSVTRWQPYQPRTLEACARHIERARAWAHDAPRTVYDLAVEYEGRVRGRVGARLRPERVATLWYVVDPRCWNRGLASAASEELISHLLDHHSIDELRAVCSVHNAASARVAAKLGFRLVSQKSLVGSRRGLCHVFARTVSGNSAPASIG